MWMALLCVLVAAREADFSEEAESRMKLSFDLDVVEEELARPAAAAPARPDLVPGVAASPAYRPPVGLPPLPLEPNSRLDAVTVYRDRAFVTRHRREALAAGWHALPFEGLPHGIQAEGLSARVIEGEARIVAVELRSGVGQVEGSLRIERVRADAEQGVAELGAIRDRIEALLAQRAYLRTALVPQSTTATPSMRQVRAGLAYVGATEERIAEQLREEQDDAGALDDVVRPLLRKLKEPLATGREVWVEVVVEHPGPVEVALRYGVGGAGWSPAYNARLDPLTGQVELEVLGVVAQSTAEDWSNASIFLATADPFGRAAVRDLVPWTLGRSGGAGVFRALQVGAGVTTGIGPVDPPARTRVLETRMDARVEDSGTLVLAIDGQRTIRGDGSPQRLPVGIQRLESVIALGTVPKVAPTVQRRAIVRVDGSVPLLPGPVSSFVQGDYVGSGQLRAVVPGEGLDLDFGTDERFRVSRQLVERTQTRVGKKIARYDFRFRTTVANHGDRDAVVAVADQLPRSEDVRIAVRALDVSGGTPPGEDGLVQWSLPVPAGGDASVEIAFSVIVPDELMHLARELLILWSE